MNNGVLDKIEETPAVLILELDGDFGLTVSLTWNAKRCKVELMI
jgi:hypothetical protein